MSTSVARSDLHPSLEVVSFLVGDWSGEGHGFYPTIEDFAYLEESRFWSTGRAVLHYEQMTRNAADGSLLHCESGYVRADGDHVELVIAHPLGIVEIEEGTVMGSRLEVASVSVASSSTAEAVAQLARTIEVKGDELTYSLSMMAVDQELQGHLEARLQRARS